MIGYVTLGTNRFDEAAQFYDELLSLVGAGRFLESDRFIAWSTSPASPALSITYPFDGNAATVDLQAELGNAGCGVRAYRGRCPLRGG